MKKDDVTDRSGVGESSQFKPQDEHLAALYSDVTVKAVTAIKWYGAARKGKRFAAVTIRWIAALSLAAAAALVALQASGNAPDIPAISLYFWTTPPIRSGLAELAFAGLGSGVLILDNIFGYSTGWVRYMLTEMAIQRAFDDFGIDWAIAVTAVSTSGTPNTTQAASPNATPVFASVGLLQQLVKAFSTKIDTLISDETQQWVVEFQSSMALLQKTAKDAQPANNYGSISISITRTGVDPTVSVEVDGQKRAETTANTVVLSNIPVGIRQIRLVGSKAGATVENFAPVTVAANAVATVSISLP